MNMLQVVVFTQEDVFFIPANVDRLAEVAEVLEIVVIDSKGSLSNKQRDFYKWFGVMQVAKMSLMYAWRRLVSLCDLVLGWRLIGGHGSLAHVAKKNGIPYRVIDNVNHKEFYNHMEALAPDLIVSYSAPQVVREPLLSLPRYGIINVHGSLLPEFRGLLPSFWVLYHNRQTTGATVHYMSDKIDDGRIILQREISLDGIKSMFGVMGLTKEIGGSLMLEAVKMFGQSRPEGSPNDTENGSYFGWPTEIQTRQFLRKGYRLA